jgi:hypothetical protein
MEDRIPEIPKISVYDRRAAAERFNLATGGTEMQQRLIYRVVGNSHNFNLLSIATTGE